MTAQVVADCLISGNNPVDSKPGCIQTIRVLIFVPVMVALAAGSDTTGSTIRNTMLHLITAPRVYSKLKETVAQAIADGLVSNPIKLEEAKKLPYLQVRTPQNVLQSN